MQELIEQIPVVYGPGLPDPEIVVDDDITQYRWDTPTYRLNLREDPCERG